MDVGSSDGDSYKPNFSFISTLKRSLAFIQCIAEFVDMLIKVRYCSGYFSSVLTVVHNISQRLFENF